MIQLLTYALTAFFALKNFASPADKAKTGVESPTQTNYLKYLIIGLALYFGYNQYKDYKESTLLDPGNSPTNATDDKGKVIKDNAGNTVKSPAVATYAKMLYAAFFPNDGDWDYLKSWLGVIGIPDGSEEGVIFAVAKSLGKYKVKFSDLSAAYELLYNDNLTSRLKSELDVNEQTIFNGLLTGLVTDAQVKTQLNNDRDWTAYVTTSSALGAAVSGNVSVIGITMPGGPLNQNGRKLVAKLNTNFMKPAPPYTVTETILAGRTIGYIVQDAFFTIDNVKYPAYYVRKEGSTVAGFVSSDPRLVKIV
jgi:hypothetical protein